MEIKKSKKANLENRRGSWFLLGLVISLSLSWMAFEYKTYDKADDLNLNNPEPFDEMDFIAQTQREEIKPPKPKIFTTIEVSKTEVPDLDINIDVEIDPNEDLILDGPFLDTLEELPPEKDIFVVVEEMPEFPGGERALLEHLSKIEYPDFEREANIQGTVYVSFIVEKDGSINDVIVLKSVSPNLDKLALERIKSMPRWKPGKQRGKAVRVKYTLPIRFVLDDQ